jgi:putative flippase GtrA
VHHAGGHEHPGGENMELYSFQNVSFSYPEWENAALRDVSFSVEGGEFLLARVFSFLVEEAGLWLLVDILGFDSFSFKIIGITITGALIAKVILAVVVIILNYFFSKFIIFKKDKESK